MQYDRALNTRIGQNAPFEATRIPFCELATYPDAPWQGMIVYREDLAELQIFSVDDDAWLPVVGAKSYARTFVGPDEPVASNLGDLWIKTPEQILHYWDGNFWLPYVEGATTFFSDVEPPEAKEGDLWYDTSQGNKLSRYDGIMWVELVLGDGALESNAFPIGIIQQGSLNETVFPGVLTLTSLLRSAASGDRYELQGSELRIYQGNALVQKLNARGTSILTLLSATVGTLQTMGATLGGETIGPAGAQLRMDALTIDQPATALDYRSTPLSQVAVSSATDATNGFIATASSTVLRMNKIKNSQGRYDLRVRVHDTDGTETSAFSDIRVNHPVDFTFNAMNRSGGRIAGLIRSTAVVTRKLFTTTLTTGAPVAPKQVDLTVPGGFKSIEEPAIGRDQMDDDGEFALAWRVNGARTVDGVSFEDGEIAVRRYSVDFNNPSDLHVVATIKTGVVSANPVMGVEIAARSTYFDLTTSTNRYGLLLSIPKGDQNGITHYILAVPDGDKATALPLTSWASRWYSSAIAYFDLAAGVLRGTSTDLSTLVTYSSAATRVLGAFHGYTYYDDSGMETTLSPLLGPASIYPRHVSEWTIPPAPEGVAKVRLYAGPDEDNLSLLGTYNTVPGSPLSVRMNAPDVAGSAVAVNPAPSASNYTIPGTTAFRIVTADPDTAISGDGQMTARAPLMPTDVANKLYVDMRTDFTRFERQSAQGMAATGFVNFATQVNATGSWLKQSGSPYAFVCQTQGFWRVAYSVVWDADPDGRRRLLIQVNGTNSPVPVDANPQMNYGYGMQISDEMWFNVGDTVSLATEQTSGNTLNILRGIATITRL